MVSVFSLFGELKLDTTAFVGSLRAAESRLDATEDAIIRTEQRAISIGATSNVTARQFDKFNTTVARQRALLNDATQAYIRGDISAKRYASVVAQVERSTASLNSRLRDTVARFADLQSKQSSFSRIGAGLNSLAGAFGLTLGIAGAVQAGRAMIDRAQEAARANRLLTASATEAGLAQDVLFGKRNDFARLTGLSNTEAASTVSQITRLATNAGMTGQIDQLLTSFADLGGARGIQGTELDSLIGTILSGQDEGLNRLGLPDPGQLYKEYAKRLGVSAESLTQQQKVRAAVEAVMQKASQFDGAAEARMGSEEGRIAAAAAEWDNLADSISKAAANSYEFNSVLDAVHGILKNVGIASDDLAAKWLAGDKSGAMAELQKQAEPGFLMGNIVNPIGVGLFGLASGLGTLLGFDEAAKNLSDTAVSLMPEYDRDARMNFALQNFHKDIQARMQQKKDAEANQKPAWQRFEEEWAKGEADRQKKIIEAQKLAQQQREQSLMQAMQREHAVIQSGYSVKEASLQKHLAATEASELQSLRATTELKNRQLQEQIGVDARYYNDLIGNAKSPEDAAKFRADRDLSVLKSQNEMRVNNLQAQTREIELMRQLKKEFASTFTDLAGQNNPFVAIFENGRLAIERIRESMKDLSPQLREMLVGMTQAQTARADFRQMIDNRVSAFNLRDEASQFRQGFLFDDTPQNQRIRLQQLLNTLPSFAMNDDQQAEIDRAIIAATQGMNPAELTAQQNMMAATAREREAERLESQRQEAQEVQRQLADVLAKLAPAVETGAVVRIINEAPDSARVSQRPKAADSNTFYSNR